MREVPAPALCAALARHGAYRRAGESGNAGGLALRQPEPARAAQQVIASTYRPGELLQVRADLVLRLSVEVVDTAALEERAHQGEQVTSCFEQGSEALGCRESLQILVLAGGQGRVEPGKHLTQAGDRGGHTAACPPAARPQGRPPRAEPHPPRRPAATPAPSQWS
ncbi:hypothetical protein [Streptomyces sp. NPDC091027]|uniref:hypothetical protein n=1 Tax=Streptomyces sp. NPDC091027 TaxID=3365971 RepID=UPI003826E216